MLTVLFLIAAVVLLGSLIRPPGATWQRIIVVLAGILLLAVLVAWGIEFMLSRA
jgi:hypothetical protein